MKNPQGGAPAAPSRLRRSRVAAAVAGLAGLAGVLVVPTLGGLAPGAWLEEAAAPWLWAVVIPLTAGLGVMAARLRVRPDRSWVPDIHPAAPPGPNIAQLLEALTALAEVGLDPRARFSALTEFEGPVREVLARLHEPGDRGRPRDGLVLCRRMATSYLGVVSAHPGGAPRAVADRALARALEYLREELLLLQFNHLPVPHRFWRIAGKCYRDAQQLQSRTGLFRGRGQRAGAAYRRLLLQGLLPPVALTPVHRAHSLRLVADHGHRLLLCDHDPETPTSRCWVDPEGDLGPRVVWGDGPPAERMLWLDAGPFLRAARQQPPGEGRHEAEPEILDLLERRFAGGVRRGQRVPVVEQATVNAGFCNAVRALRAEGRGEALPAAGAEAGSVHEVVCEAGGFREWESDGGDRTGPDAERHLARVGVTARVIDLSTGGCRLQLPPHAASVLRVDQPALVRMSGPCMEFGWVRWLNPGPDGTQAGIEILADRPQPGRLRLVTEDECEAPLDCFIDDYQGEPALFHPQMRGLGERRLVLDLAGRSLPVRLGPALFHDAGFEIRRFFPLEQGPSTP